MPIVIVEPRASWPAEFTGIACSIRAVLGESAIRIDHIGSTAVPGLPAKDIIDVQVTVDDLGQSAIVSGLESMGAADSGITTDHLPPGMDVEEAELTKRLFALRGPHRAANIHVREEGRFNQQYPILCRDYLRAHAGAAAAYGEIKKELARHFPEDAEAYYAVKDPVFDILMAGAREWADRTGWEPAASDA